MFLREPKAPAISKALSESSVPLLPVSCLVEFSAVNRFGPTRFSWIEAVIADLDIEIVGIDASFSYHAVEAARRYGKGSGHPAQLNFGDCLSYAVAKSRDLPLLYVGDDFRHTDIDSVL